MRSSRVDKRVKIHLLNLSDLHLGQKICQWRLILAILRYFDAKIIVLNGDSFNNANVKLPKKHRRVVTQLDRENKRGVDVIVIPGNHDWWILDLHFSWFGARTQETYRVVINGIEHLFLHGHQFDVFTKKYPQTTEIAAQFYEGLQSILGPFADPVCRKLKKGAKGYARALRYVAEGAIAYAKSLGCPRVLCGHTHQAEHTHNGGVLYVNSGCHTESPATCVTIDEDARLRLWWFRYKKDDKGKRRLLVESKVIAK